MGFSEGRCSDEYPRGHSVIARPEATMEGSREVEVLLLD